ncbi:MAG: hypothetical protein KKF54_09375 [Candidatus Omnitrophica bacterium]|nr:hypothetical protein [Candidatus Omnitrophota bacterium]
MIVKMQELTLLVMNKYGDDALRKLRKLGVVHINHVRRPHAEGIVAIEHRLEELKKALFILSHYKVAEKKEKLDKEKITGCVKDVLSLDKEKGQLQDHLAKLEIDLTWFKEWGNVAESTLSELNQCGVYIKLYNCSSKFLKKIDTKKVVYVLDQQASNIKIALVSQNPNDSLELIPVKVPDANLHSVNRKIAVTSAQINDINRRLIDAAGNMSCLLRCKKDLLRRLDFFKVKFGMSHGDVFSYLQGFCPKESAEGIKTVAQEEGWGYFFQEPDDLSEVPTLIRNPKWLQIINPVFKFMGILPAYNEMDISFWFLFFFSLFFAMLIGDAGYGLIFLILTIVARKKFPKIESVPFFLIGVLSCSTILWGAVTGTWFGVENIGRLPVFRYFVIDKMNSFVGSNQTFMMYLCFLVGIIQLTIAHVIKAIRYINSPAALGQVGWIGILWGLFFVIGKFVLNNALPSYFPVLMGGGIGLVVLFSHPEKNIIKGQLIALGNLPLSIINSFADLLSYLRLFVIGYVSVMVAASFNDMAMQVGFNNILSGLGAGLILFFGHALNIVLGLLSVLVHGIRLNMLEFSSHLDVQWAGKDYSPFRE